MTESVQPHAAEKSNGVLEESQALISFKVCKPRRARSAKLTQRTDSTLWNEHDTLSTCLHDYVEEVKKRTYNLNNWRAIVLYSRHTFALAVTVMTENKLSGRQKHALLSLAVKFCT